MLPQIAKKRLANLPAPGNRSTKGLSFESILREYADDPEGFCSAFLVCRDQQGQAQPFELWEAQRKAARAVVKHRRVARRSGHKVGKSKLAAALVIWWCCTRAAARGIVTAPTSRQVKKALWYEITRFWRESPALQAIMPEPALEPETGIRWDDGRELFGFTATSADKVSGPGGPAVFVVVDEASGVPRDVWEALQGIRAGGGKVLALGNPTQTSGWFYDAFNERRDGWDLDRISSRDTPNYIEGRQVVAGLADREFAEEIANDYGVDSPAYAVRVLGEFPRQVANAVIGLGSVELARDRWDDADDETAPLELGIDVARFGDDDSAVAGRVGLKLFSPKYFEDNGDASVVHGYNSIAVAASAVQCMNRLRKRGQRVRFKIDVTGGFGEPVAEQLRVLRDTGALEFPEQIEIIEVNFAGEASDPDKYPVIRDELWFGGRTFFNEGGALYPDPKLESELVASIYAPDVRGRNKVEKKSETKKRLGRSPDRADAALLAIYAGGATPIDDDEDESQLEDDEPRWGSYQGRGFG